jgi:hypothetical protein
MTTQGDVRVARYLFHRIIRVFSLRNGATNRPKPSGIDEEQMNFCQTYHVECRLRVFPRHPDYYSVVFVESINLGINLRSKKIHPELVEKWKV